MKLRRAAGDMGTKVPVPCASFHGLARVAVRIAAALLIVNSTMAQLTWKRTYGGADVDQGKDVITMPDDGAVVCGSTGSFGTGGDLYVFRVDNTGSMLWSRHLGGSGVESGAAAVHLGQGRVAVCGFTNSIGHGGYDGYLAVLNDLGEVEWESAYGGEGWDFFRDIVQIPAGLLIVGSSTSYNDAGLEQLWVTLLSEDGEELWSSTFEEVASSNGRAICVAQNGDPIVVGSAFSDVDDGQLLVVRFSDSGIVEWYREVGGTGFEDGYSVLALPGDEIAAVGYTESFSDARQMYLARFDADGLELGSGPISSSGNDWEAHALVLRADGNLAIAGYTKEYGAGGKDYSLLFCDTNGGFIGGPTYGGGGNDEAWGLARTLDGGYYIVGSTQSYGPGAQSVYLIRSDGDTLNGSIHQTFDTVGLVEIFASEGGTMHPNPAVAGCTVTLPLLGPHPMTVTIHDDLGRAIAQVPIFQGRFVVPDLPVGAYVIRLVGREVSYRSRLFIE